MWEVFRRWLIGDMGNPGVFEYKAMHLYTVFGVAMVCILVGVLGSSRRINNEAKRKQLYAVAWFQLGFELTWRLIFFFLRGDSVLSWWPCYPCNVGGILLPIIALTNWEKGKKMFYLFGFFGGVITFAVPDGIFCRDVYVFPILKSVLQHTGILLIPLMEYAMGNYRPTLKHMPWVILGLLIHLFNCEVITRLLGFTGDYMFFRSGIPFVIPGVPQFVTVSVMGVAVLVLLSVASDPWGSVAFVKSLLKKRA